MIERIIWLFLVKPFLIICAIMIVLMILYSLLKKISENIVKNIDKKRRDKKCKIKLADDKTLKMDDIIVDNIVITENYLFGISKKDFLLYYTDKPKYDFIKQIDIKNIKEIKYENPERTETYSSGGRIYTNLAGHVKGNIPETTIKTIHEGTYLYIKLKSLEKITLHISKEFYETDSVEYIIDLIEEIKPKEKENIIEELEKLEKLKKEKVITDKEFKKAKSLLLNENSL